MAGEASTQPQRALALLEGQGPLRLADFLRHGITAATIQRLERKGKVARVERGLYRLCASEVDARRVLALAAEHVPGGTVCLASALAFHELTESVPARVWLAIGNRAPRPLADGPPLKIVRFGPRALHSGVEEHAIEGVAVRIYDPAKTIVDLFRHRQSAGAQGRWGAALHLAVDGLRAGLRTGKAPPERIARYAEENSIWSVVQPYLEALTA